MTQQPLTDRYQSPFVASFLKDPTALYPGYGAPRTLPVDPVVVTGQQVGLFGGPLYCLLKIRTAVQRAQDLSAVHGIEVQPVFWLEDNDSDAAEASTTWLPETDGSLIKRVLNEGNANTPVGQLTFNAEDVALVHDWADLLAGRYADETQERLKQIYQEGRSWSDAFFDVMAPFLDAWDVTVVRASEIIAKGAHLDLVRRDLESNELVSTVQIATDRLIQHGFTPQAAVPDALFFLVADGERQRLTRTTDGFTTPDGRSWSKHDLLSILDSEPERFLPNVAGRPLVQDIALPNISTVLGAAELAYHAQLVDLYAAANVQQPTPFLRHHACVLDSKAERLLDKLNVSLDDMYRPWQEIERSVVTASAADVLEDLDVDDHIASAVAPYLQAAQDVDPTLVKAVHAAQANIENTLSGLRGKLKGAVKRTEQDHLTRLHALWWMVYPNGSLSERIIPLSMWVSRVGADSLRIIAERVCAGSSDVFTTIGISDVDTK